MTDTLYRSPLDAPDTTYGSRSRICGGCGEPLDDVGHCPDCWSRWSKEAEDAQYDIPLSDILDSPCAPPEYDLDELIAAVPM